MRKTTTLLTTFLVAAVMAIQPSALMAETWWDAVADGGFELGSPNAVWNEYSEYAGIVIMQDVATAHTGAWYASFGTEWPAPESAWLAQDIMLGTGAATISFWWTRPFESENNEDILALNIDGNIVWLDQPYPGIGPLDHWILEEIDISQFADGGSHQIFFEMMSTGTSNTDFGTLWLVDDVSVMTHDLETLFADFYWEPANPMVGEQVQFWDSTTGGADQWYWDFGDGQSSTEQHPIHVWDQPGDYPVTLTISRSGGADFSVTHTVTVSDDPMTAAFTWEPLEPHAGEPVSFFDQSTGDPDTWVWQFGDGLASDQQNPVHTFEQTGEYIVTLTVSQSDDPTISSTAERIITVAAPAPTVWFEWIPSEPIVGTLIEFIDMSEGDIIAWEWNFGDGTTSTEQFPSHTYFDAGDYDVTLTATDTTGVSAEVVREVLVSDDPYLAHFSWLPETPHVGRAVEFFDHSQGGPLAWHWNFGDGRTSTQQHPVHWFEQGGAFDVTLTVAFDTDGTILRSTTQTVVVADRALEADFFWTPLIPKAGENVNFNDISQGRPTSRFWQFGDGSTSEIQNPIHAFQSPGQYTVSLTVERSDGKTVSTDTRTRIIRVTQDVAIDFSWSPHEPRALESVQFTEDIDLPVSGRLWAFGDSQTSTEENPTHTYQRPGIYRVQLWAADVEGNILAAAEHEILVLPPDLDISLVVSNAAPDIGEAISFHLGGIENFEGIQWAFGGIGCDGNPGQATCIPNDMDDCLTANYVFATAGLKPVRAWIRLEGGAEVGPFSIPVRVNSHGRCTSTPQADFTWWPPEPVAGQPVRCVDHSVGPPDSWTWTFDDGSVSSSQHATHVFETPGEHLVELTITNLNGQSTITKTINVGAAGATCGNEICEPGENSWTCPADCLDNPNGTGRIGRKNTNLMIPAAVGGVSGANGTYWVTEGSIVNPGEEDVQVVVEFVPDGNPGSPRVAGPVTIPPRTAIHFDNIIEELFGLHKSGSLWIDANKPVIANTRTFNRAGEATFGQGIGGITKNDVLGMDEGSVFIVGLKQTDRYRTNFLFQEVSGHDATVDTRIFDATGTLIGSGSINVPAKTKWQKPITNLGISSLEAGYAVLSVEGHGKIAAMASVIDQVTGDATSLDAVHSLQTGAGPPGKAGGEDDESHFLVAVVARTPGSNDTVWRSEISILNTEETDQVLELRYVPAEGDMQTATRELPGGELFFSEDVIEEVFPEAVNGAGSLHVYAQKGLVVNSRTYNVLPDQSTVGQAIPGLANGDMARPGEVWLLDSLKQTKDFRCNMGFAEFEGSEAEVTVILFDTDGASLFFLGSKQYTVPAFGQFQVNKVFRDMGLNGNFREAIAYVTVSSEGGAIYAYASIVDNKVGDGTTILGKRQ